MRLLRFAPMAQAARNDMDLCILVEHWLEEET